jgi:hypothetical protein
VSTARKTLSFLRAPTSSTGRTVENKIPGADRATSIILLHDHSRRVSGARFVPCSRQLRSSAARRSHGTAPAPTASFPSISTAARYSRSNCIVFSAPPPPVRVSPRPRNLPPIARELDAEWSPQTDNTASILSRDLRPFLATPIPQRYQNANESTVPPLDFPHGSAYCPRSNSTV